MPADWIVPDWPAPAHVAALITSRNGGVSQGPFGGIGGGMNLSTHCGDDPAAVRTNRARLSEAIAARPRWLRQVHGTQVVDAASVEDDREADASFSRQVGCACAVLVADCLPVLMCDDRGLVVAAAHAGWRGLAAGILERTVQHLKVPSASVMAYLGPAIGAQSFEVGEDVWHAFCNDDHAARHAFHAQRAGKYLADLYALARLRLRNAGVERVYGGGCCTLSSPAQFYSYRREPTTGRIAGLVWLARD